MFAVCRARAMSMACSETPEMQGCAAVDVFSVVESWSGAWNLDAEGRDRLSFDGIPCGDAIRIDVFEFVLERVNAALGLPPRRLGRPLLRPLRARGLDREIRTWGLRAASMGRRQPHETQPVVFISEGATPSALESSMAVAAELTSTRAAIGASDPRTYRAWRRAGWDPSALVLGPRDDRSVTRHAAARSMEAWREARSHCPPLVIDGMDLTSAALEAMDSFVPRSVRRLAVDWTAIGRFLDASDADAVVLASDQHRTGRLAVEIARQEGRRSVVLQHGLPQNRTGYVPVHADFLMAWSEASASWFVAQGTPPERIQIVGNPRLDRLADVTSRSIDQVGTTAAVSGGGRRVLLALSVAPVAVNVRLVEIVLDAVQSIAGTTLIIKVHPGGSDWGFVRRLVGERVGVQGAVRIVEREDLYALIAWSNVVVVHRSSVAAEALAARRPVIAVTADGTSVASQDLPGLNLPEVGDAPGLAALIVDHARDVAGAAFIADRKAAISAAVGPLDGLAARRAADAIAGLAKGQVHHSGAGA